MRRQLFKGKRLRCARRFERVGREEEEDEEDEEED